MRNVVAGLKDDEFYCPGSLLRLLVKTSHPLGWGLRRNEVALFMHSPVFETAGSADARTTVVAEYPLHEQNLSGWILGADKLAGKAALVEVELGDGPNPGRVILLGFRSHFRAQARGSYKALFNAILRAGQQPTA